MNILIYGAGAIGGWLGTNLASVGHTVAFVARPHSVETIRENGIPVIELGERLEAPVGAYPSLAEAVSAVDWELVILAVKSYHLPEIEKDIAENFPSVPMVIITQNGIGIEDGLIAQLGARRVLSSSITESVSRLEDGSVRAELGKRGIVIAPTQKGQSIEQWINIFDGTKVGAFAEPDYRSMKWSKALFNFVGNASSAILDMHPREIYGHDGLFEMERQMHRELIAVMKKLGVKPIKFGGIPAPFMVWGLTWLPKPIAQRAMLYVVKRGRGDKMPSFHIDISQGRSQSEVLYHNTSLARIGQENGVPTPVNATLSRILHGMLDGEVNRDEYRHNPERLLAEIKK